MRDLIQLTDLAHERAEHMTVVWNAILTDQTEPMRITPEEMASMAMIFTELLFHYGGLQNDLIKNMCYTAYMAVKDKEIEKSLLEASHLDAKANPEWLPRDEDAGL